MSSSLSNTFSKEIRISTWETAFGKVYSHRCSHENCSNTMKVSEFEVEYIDNVLKPICNKCKIQINEYQPLIKKTKTRWWLNCFY